MKSKTFTLTGLLMALFFTSLTAQDFDIFVSDAAGFNVGPWHIYKYDQDGKNGVKFISDHLGWPQDIVFLEHENTVLISNLNDGTITKYNADTGEYIGDFATGIGSPTRMEIGPDSLLYVLQWEGNGKVKRYKLDGSYVDDFTSKGVTNSIGLAWDNAGALYVSSYDGKYVRKFGGTGVDLGNFISTNLNGPTNIWFGENGDLFVLDWQAGQVKRFNSFGAFQGAIVTGVGQAEGIDFYPNGDFAIGIGSASSVNVYHPDGTFVKNLVAPGAAGVIRPNAVVFRHKNTTATQEVFKEVTFVTPSVGVHFQVSNPDVAQSASS
ncbi:MAG: hypothetical protein R2825_31295, partial [Saprospiraceae bacterium]